MLLRVVARFKWTTVDKLIERIQEVGRRLIEAQPREMVVGNIVRRVLGMIRDEVRETRLEENSDSSANGQVDSPRLPQTNTGFERSPLANGAIFPSDITGDERNNGFGPRRSNGPLSRPALLTSHTSYAALNGVPVQQSMFNLLSASGTPNQSPPGTESPSGKQSPNPTSLSNRITTSTKDLKAEIISGIEEIIDELLQADEQIAGFAKEHIHSNEIILTHTASRTVHSFLLEAARKRKFTVIYAESYPNDHEETHEAVMGKTKQGEDDDDEMSTEAFMKPLTAAGITVILITDAAVFALMSRVNKVILGTHAVIASGGLVAAAGTRLIAKAAHKHRTPVIVLSGIYKLSPDYPNEFDSLIEYGDTGKIISYEEGELVENVDVDNPVYDYVPPDLVDLYITNL